MSPAAQISPSLLICIPLLITFIAHSSTAFTVFRISCIDNGPRYSSNVKALLSSLSSAANGSASSGYHYATLGANTSTAVYGFYLCRGDDSPATCAGCVASASAAITESCPSAKIAATWYAECMLRYSNESFLGHLNEIVYAGIPALQNVTSNVTGFSQVLNATLKVVAKEASEGGTQLKYATTKAQYFDGGMSTDLYALAQCTPDLSARDCRRCLQDCIDVVFVYYPTAQGTCVMAFNCILQYENYLFYVLPTVAQPPSPDTTATATAPGLNISNSPSNIRGGAKKKSSSKVVVGVITGATAAGLIAVVGVICLIQVKKKKRMVEAPVENASVVSDDFDTAESLLYDFDALQAATNNFADDTKIGQGGFGSVYKGILPDGQEIAVKRMSRSSGKVVQELKNEVVLVAKLQHRNLLRLLGFCLAGEENVLIYEYAPNKSLDTFLFDPYKRGQLDWPTRYKIIIGVARGMLYLHEDSQLRIVHRDLKASNVLLDSNMNPKISDFGIARIFSGDQTHGNTCRVVGTYGYIAPEYAMHGKFSVKSDVYSFGVLVLEIISGKRNSKFHSSGNAEDLLSYAWRLWSQGRPMEFLDPLLRDSCSNNEVLRCIHLGLLCVQDDMTKRPLMSKIVLMLNSYSVNLPTPHQPVYIRRRTSANVSTDKSTSKSESLSVNDVTMTEVGPR